MKLQQLLTQCILIPLFFSSAITLAQPAGLGCEIGQPVSLDLMTTEKQSELDRLADLNLVLLIENNCTGNCSFVSRAAYYADNIAGYAPIGQHFYHMPELIKEKIPATDSGKISLGANTVEIVSGISRDSRLFGAKYQQVYVNGEKSYAYSDMDNLEAFIRLNINSFSEKKEEILGIFEEFKKNLTSTTGKYYRSNEFLFNGERKSFVYLDRSNEFRSGSKHPQVISIGMLPTPSKEYIPVKSFKKIKKFIKSMDSNESTIFNYYVEVTHGPGNKSNTGHSIFLKKINKKYIEVYGKQKFLGKNYQRIKISDFKRYLKDQFRITSPKYHAAKYKIMQYNYIQLGNEFENHSTENVR